jgi:hypothetical protein
MWHIVHETHKTQTTNIGTLVMQAITIVQDNELRPDVWKFYVEPQQHTCNMGPCCRQWAAGKQIAPANAKVIRLGGTRMQINRVDISTCSVACFPHASSARK